MSLKVVRGWGVCLCIYTNLVLNLKTHYDTFMKKKPWRESLINLFEYKIFLLVLYPLLLFYTIAIVSLVLFGSDVFATLEHINGAYLLYLIYLLTISILDAIYEDAKKYFAYIDTIVSMIFKLIKSCFDFQNLKGKLSLIAHLTMRLVLYIIIKPPYGIARSRKSTYVVVEALLMIVLYKISLDAEHMSTFDTMLNIVLALSTFLASHKLLEMEEELEDLWKYAHEHKLPDS